MFLKKLMKNNKNYSNNDFDSDNNQMNENEFKRKFERKLVLCQSDPEPVIDLSSCRLESIGVNVLSTIRIYNKTQCRFDHNLLTTFGTDSMVSMQSITSLHLSYNRIHTIGPYISNLTQLRELYLSHNQISSLPNAISRLNQLKILSLRDNKFTQFPEVLTDSDRLSCIDLGDNRLSHLPQSLLKLKLLKSLQLDGNPMSVPSKEVCDQGIDDIISELKRIFNTNDNIEYESENISNDLTQSTVRHDSKEDNHNYDDIDQDQKKRNLIEWERTFQSNQSNASDSKEFKNKKEILTKLWKEQRLMSANISNIQLRKAKDKETILNQIVQLDQHSKELIDSLNNWEQKQKQQLEMLEEAENVNLEMMLRYDHKVNLKKNAILIAMQEMLSLESVKFTMTDELKESNQLEMRTKINQKEQLQREAFEALQRSRDYRNQLITNQILLVENELTNLTQAEMQKKDERLDCIMNDIRTQRSKLALLLSKLLADKKERELQLRDYLIKMEKRRNQVEDDNFWLVQYQYLLEQQPIQTQIQQYGIEDRVGLILKKVSEDNDRILNYLPLFAQMTFDRLNSMADKDLLHLGIDDYELCKEIRDKIDEQCYGSASALPPESASAPHQAEVLTPDATQPSTSTSTFVYEGNESFCDIKIWCQTECVICFDLCCNVVFLPCGHVCTCDHCCLLITSCPMCRVHIQIQQRLNDRSIINSNNDC